MDTNGLAQFLDNLLNLELSVDIQRNLLFSLLSLLIIGISRWLLIRIVHRRYQDNPRLLYNWRKGIGYAANIIGIILISRIWLEGVGTLVTYLGLLSAGIAIALQDIIVSLAGWFFILWRRPFVVGDRIEIGNHAGDVIDIRSFAFSLLEIGDRIDAEQSTGRILHVPNSTIFKEVLANTHQGLPYIWNEVAVMITFESDWEKAKTLLTDIVREHAPDVGDAVRQYARRTDQRFVISYGNVNPTVYTKVADSGVVLTMRYMLDPRKRRNSEQQIWEATLRAFKQHADIDLAYPTHREYRYFEEANRPPPAANAAGQHAQPGSDDDA